MSIEELLSKIIVGSVTPQDFYAYSMNIEKLLNDITYGEPDKILGSFGFYTARNYNQGWGIPTSLVIGFHKPQKSSSYKVIKLTGGKRAMDKEYTVEITYPV